MSKSKRDADKPKPLPKRVVKVIDRLKAGEVLCRAYRPRALGETDSVVIWWFEPSGIECGPVSARQAVETAEVVACDAGLFNDGNAQSFVAASAALLGTWMKAGRDRQVYFTDLSALPLPDGSKSIAPEPVLNAGAPNAVREPFTATERR